MRVLVVGSGVIGSVYGERLAAGHPVAILGQAARDDRVARAGLAAHDVIAGHMISGPATVVPDAAGGPYDLVVVAVRRVADMDGWLAYHAAFVAWVAAARYRCGTGPRALAADRPALRLMSAAVTEAFAGLRKLGVGGRPRNLGAHHGLHPWASSASRPTAGMSNPRCGSLVPGWRAACAGNRASPDCSSSCGSHRCRS
jgi:hypothetical protein